jgi:hypothetical protein
VVTLALTLIKHGSATAAVGCAWLWLLPAFEQVSSSAVFELLQAAVSNGARAAFYIAAICGVPAARQLSSESLQQLLLAAKEQHGQHVSSKFVMTVAELASRCASGGHS